MEERKYSRSVSQLRALTGCGERFRLERLNRRNIQVRPAAWTILGIAAHEVFENWELSNRSFDPVEAFGEVFDRIVEEEKEKQPDLSVWMKAPRSKNTENDIANYRKRGIEKDVPSYLKRCLEAEWSILELPDGSPALELKFEIDFDGVLVRGAVDKVLWYPSLNAPAVEDLKTGSPDDAEDVRQLALYRVALGEVYDIDLRWGRFFYTKLDRPGDWVDLTRYSREYLSEQYRILDQTVQQGLLLPRPGKQCGICSVRPWCKELGWLKLGEKL